MKLKILLQSNFIIFIYIKFTQSEYNHHNKLPWFLKGNSLYYIETRANFTSEESRTECKAKDMIAVIEKYDTYSLETLTQLYDKLPNFWIINNYKSLSVGKHAEYSLSQKSTDCFRINAYDSTIIAENCSTPMGFICRAFHYGATAFYKNGTNTGVRYQEVDTLCDPHSNSYDETLELCILIL